MIELTKTKGKSVAVRERFHAWLYDVMNLNVDCCCRRAKPDHTDIRIFEIAVRKLLQILSMHLKV